MIRVLDWLRAAIGALLETCMGRLGLESCAVEAANKVVCFWLPVRPYWHWVSLAPLCNKAGSWR